MMKRLGIRGLTIASLVATLALMVPALPARAESSLFFSPSSGQVQAGALWSTAVMINAPEAVNSADVTVSFAPSVLELTDVSLGGSVLPLQVQSPAVDNSGGSVRLVQGSSTPYTGSGGKMATLTFKAKTNGTASLSFAASKVIANDGKGTNTYSGDGGTASVGVSSSGETTQTSGGSTSGQTSGGTTSKQPTGPKTMSVSITSKTHPDQAKWYKSRDVSYSWTGGAQSYNYTINQDPSTELPDQVAASVTSASTTLPGDGVWYAHVKALTSAGWGPTAHFRFQVDTEAPASFQPEVTPKGEISVLPFVTFSTSDSTSGVDHYEVIIDTSSSVVATNPYKVPKIGPGEHKVTVRAVDKAGNVTEGKTSFTIKPLETPKITEPQTNSIFALGDQLKILGEAAPRVTVDIYLNNKQVDSVTTDSKGHFVTKQNLFLFPGKYSLMAKAVNADGIESAPSAGVQLMVDAKAVKVFGRIWPGWVVFGVLTVLIVALGVAVGWLGLQLWRLNRRWWAKVHRLNRQVDEDLGKLETTVDMTIEQAVHEDGGKQLVKKTLEHEVTRVERDLDIATHEPVMPASIVDVAESAPEPDPASVEGKAAATESALGPDDEGVRPLTGPTEVVKRDED